MEPTTDIKVSNSLRNIVKLALPISIAIFIPQLNNLTNTLFLGNYEPANALFSMKDLLAASGIAGIYYLTLVMIGYGVSAGLLMLMSRRAGEEDKKALGHYLSNGIFIALSLSLFLLMLSYAIAPWLFGWAIHDEQIRYAAIEFIHIRSWGLPFIMIAQVGNSFFLSVSKSKFIIPGTLMQTITNIVLDYFLIFGIGIFPEMGLNGTALASVISEMVFMSVVLMLILKFPSFKDFGINLLKRPDWQQVKLILVKSSPLILQHFLSIGAWELFFIYVEHLGPSESAVSQVLRSVFGLVGVFTWAFASTCNSMVSNLIGQGLVEEVIPLIKKITQVSFALSFILGIPMMLFPSEFLSVLVHDVELVEVGTDSLRIVVLAIWTLSISTISFNGVLGTGNTRLNMIFELIAIVMYVLYIHIVVENLRLPLVYAWASEFVYWMSLFVLSAGYLYSGRWKKHLKLEDAKS